MIIFHKDQNNIFRVVTKVEGSDNLKGYCPENIILVAKIDFPVVTEAVSCDCRGLNVQAEQCEPFGYQAHLGIIALMIVLMITNYHAIRSGLKNPVNSLRTE